jgi:hypothetical protein
MSRRPFVLLFTLIISIDSAGLKSNSRKLKEQLTYLIILIMILGFTTDCGQGSKSDLKIARLGDETFSPN